MGSKIGNYSHAKLQGIIRLFLKNFKTTDVTPAITEAVQDPEAVADTYVHDGQPTVQNSGQIPPGKIMAVPESKVINLPERPLSALDKIRLTILGFSSDQQRALETFGIAKSARIKIRKGSIVRIVGRDSITRDFFPNTKHINPQENEVTILGAPDAKFGNAYFKEVTTGDLNLKGPNGNWTILEQQDHIVARNNDTGKRYKLLMEELEE